MGGSSFLHAFRLLGRKPMLLLLLLPLHLVMPLFFRLIAAPGTSSLGLEYYDMYNADAAMAAMMGSLAYLFGLMLLILFIYLLVGFILIPPAMELLHDGAQGKDTPKGWFGRGLRSHWWKPVTLGAIECTIITILSVILSVILAFTALFSMPGLGSGDYGSDNFGAFFGISLPEMVLNGIFALVAYLIYCFFAMLLPAMADRSFGASFRALFSGYGFKKYMKVTGVYLLTDIAAVILYLAFAAGYLFFSGSLTSPSEWEFAMASFPLSWTGYGASAVIAFTVLFKYAYIFCVFQEIKNKEDAAFPATAVPILAGEAGGNPQIEEGGEPS